MIQLITDTEGKEYSPIEIMRDYVELDARLVDGNPTILGKHSVSGVEKVFPNNGSEAFAVVYSGLVLRTKR